MRVLDIDLDFFLADCCPLAELGHRPSLPGHEPWEASAVRAFLENQCGLSRTAPKPGRIFETHDGALRFWEEQIAAGRLTAPFDVTHVDAHSDLGIGYPGPNFVLFNVLSMPVPKRLDYTAFYAQKKLDEANYLLFALAMALSFIEGTLVIPGLAPGMKLGLANIVVMYALFFMGARQALYLDLLKALFVFLVSGWTAGFLSLCGGLLSLLVMWVLYYKLPFRPTWFILSVCGALSHNIGQLLGAGLILSSAMSLYYAPVMLVLGLVMGALTSLTLRAILPALGRLGYNTREKR